MTIDINEVIVLINGVDKTSEIRSVEEDTKRRKTIVTYKSSSSYPYNSANVKIIRNPEKIELSGEVAYIKDMPISDYKCILKFGKFIKITGKNGTLTTVKEQEFSIVPNQIENERVKDVLDYLKDIAQYTTDEKEESFLKKEMEQIKFVHPDSVLSNYLNCQLPKVKSISENKLIFPFSFNLSQKQALENALTNSISVIEGPPGTGKTQTILNIIANLVAIQGKSVAVVSNNNEAVKNVLEKMEKRGYGFMLAMLGRGENQDKFFENMPEGDVDGWNCQETKEELLKQVERLNITLNMLLRLDRECKLLQQELRAWRLEQQHFMKHYQKQEIEEITKFPLFYATPERILSFLAETAWMEECELNRSIFQRLKLLLKYGVFDYDKLRRSEKDLLLSLQKEFYVKRIEGIEKRIFDIKKQMEAKSFEEISKHHQEVSEKMFRKYLYERYTDLPKKTFTRKNYKVQYQDFIKKYPVILSTTYSLRRSIPQNYLLDYVIIDESSQVDLITGVLAFSCCRNVIIVGDEKQLPQIVDTQIMPKLKTVAYAPSYDYFSHSILTSVASLYGERLSREILREHYRCHPQIIEFCNQKYYEGKLIAYTSDNISESPLCVYKTAPGNHMRRVTQGDNRGRYNQREIDVIINEVIQYVDGVDENDDMGFVTPYRKQADKAGEFLPKSVESDTVHKYQGRERDIMIMSTVLDNTRDGCLGISFVDDPHMVNVAVSRAVKKFVLVTDNDLFFKRGKEIADLIRYIQYNTLDKNVIESEIISVFDLLYREYSPKLNAIKQKMSHTARYKTEEAIRVLLEEIILLPRFQRFSFSQGVLLRNLLNNTQLLSEPELRFVHNRASLDFVIHNRLDKTCVLVIEVDGFAFHENRPEQLKRDKMKDEILKKYNFPVLRLASNGSMEREKIEKALEEIE